MTNGVVAFGEILMRLSPNGYSRFKTADRYDVYFGGAEANSAETLSQLGIDSRFVTKLPDNALGDGAVTSLNRFGVDTSFIVRGGDRIGLYFLENGTAQRPAMTIYDRAGSAMAGAEASDFNWDQIFEGADWFQFSGITPALSDEMAECTLLALKKAKEKGLTTSCDLNYRSKMWAPEKAREVMGKLLPFVDYFIANDKDVLGIYDNHTWTESDPKKRAEEMEIWLTEQFGFKAATIILVVSDELKRKGTWASLYENGKFYSSPFFLADMVESVGAGDTYAGAFIAARKKGMTDQDAVNYSAATSALKFSVPGDANILNEKEVLALVNRSADDWISR